MPQNFKYPWNFLSERSVCDANEVTQGEPLDTFRMGLVTRKTKP